MDRQTFVLSTPIGNLEAEKLCAFCGRAFRKDPRNTWRYWSRAKYCSQSCSAEDHSRRAAENRKSYAEAFWLNVRKTDKCWLWTAAADKDGYGAFSYAGKMRRANRVALELDGRPASPNQYACHTCDNPTCVRPQHLYPGTPTQNMADASSRGRVHCGEGVHSAKLSAADVEKIRASTAAYETIARVFNVSRSNISMIRNRRTWKHVP